jgi:hypothetical protein
MELAFRSLENAFGEERVALRGKGVTLKGIGVALRSRRIALIAIVFTGRSFISCKLPNRRFI